MCSSFDVVTYHEKGCQKEKRADEIQSWESDGQSDRECIFAINALLDGINNEVEIPTNHSNHKEVNCDSSCFDLRGYDVNNDGKSDPNPHLADDVGWNQHEKTPRVSWYPQCTQSEWSRSQLQLTTEQKNKVIT